MAGGTCQTLVRVVHVPLPTPQELGPLPHEDGNLMLHLQRLETTLSVCAEESDHSQLFMHLGRMALEFNRLASKVHKNEQRTSILQVSLGRRRAARDRRGFPPPPPARLGSPGYHGDFRGGGRGPAWASCSGRRAAEGSCGKGQGRGRGRKLGHNGWTMQVSWLGPLEAAMIGPAFVLHIRWGREGTGAGPPRVSCPCRWRWDGQYPRLRR